MAIVQLDLQGNILRKFSSAGQAASATGLNQSHISDCLSGTRKTVGGFRWKYVRGSAGEKKFDLFCQSCADRIPREKFIVCFDCFQKTKR